MILSSKGLWSDSRQHGYFLKRKGIEARGKTGKGKSNSSVCAQPKSLHNPLCYLFPFLRKGHTYLIQNSIQRNKLLPGSQINSPTQVHVLQVSHCAFTTSLHDNNRCTYSWKIILNDKTAAGKNLWCSKAPLFLYRNKKNQVTNKGTIFICNDYFFHLFNTFINLLNSLTSEWNMVNKQQNM